MQIRPLGNDGRTDGQTYMKMPIGVYRHIANARATNFCNLSVNKLFCSTHEIHENRRNILYTLPERVNEFTSVHPIVLHIFMSKTF